MEENSLTQYGRKNNTLLSGIPDFIHNNLENKWRTNKYQKKDIGACHRFGKADVRLESKKTIVTFINRKSCNQIFENKKKLAK